MFMHLKCETIDPPHSCDVTLKGRIQSKNRVQIEVACEKHPKIHYLKYLEHNHIF